MRFSLTRVLLPAAAALMLGSCSSASQMSVAPERFDAAGDRGMPGAELTSQNGALLYVTNYSSTVTIYSYPRGKKVGVIGGLSSALGVCTDPAQNVYITDVGDSTIYEYRHGGTTPVKVLSDPYGWPENCAVDAHTGNLAVNSDYFNTPGSILIYPAATGSPTRYSVDGFCHYGSIAYDQKGNLFVDGYSGGCSQQTSQPNFDVFELLPGHKTFRLIKLKTPMKIPPASPLALRSDGIHLLVGDYLNCRIDRYTVASHRAKFIGSIHVQGIPYLHNFIVSKVASSYRVISDGNDTILSWQYPQGGAPIEQIRHVKQPVEFALSE